MVRITRALIRRKCALSDCSTYSLKKLSLEYNDIERIERFHHWCRNIKILLMQSNLIAKIENLFKLKRLEHLNLANNHIERIENLEQLESLHKLDLSLNAVGELTSIERLRGNYNLHELNLAGNPCCSYPNYRSYVVATLPQLKSFDCMEITKKEKLEMHSDDEECRAVIVQKQVDYAMERDEQKLRMLSNERLLEKQKLLTDDGEQAIRLFWIAMNEQSPNAHYDVLKCKKLDSPSGDDTAQESLQLVTPCGRPYNLNQAKLEFSFQDEPSDYILVLYVYKYMDSSELDYKFDVNFIRVIVRDKIFQIHLTEDVNPTDTIIQRSKITGYIQIRVTKVNIQKIIVMKSNNSLAKPRWSIAKDKNIKSKPIHIGSLHTAIVCDGSGESDFSDERRKVAT